MSLLEGVQDKNVIQPLFSIIGEFSKFEEELATILSVISDKYNKPDKQMVVFEITEEGNIHLCGSSYLKGRYASSMILWDGVTSQAVDVATYTQGKQRHAIPVKRITDIIGRFKGLRRTEATAIIFNFYKDYCGVNVIEKGADYTEEDEQMGFPDPYAQSSPFKIPTVNIPPLVVKELDELSFVTDPMSYESYRLKVYMDFIYPQIAEEIAQTNDAIVFLDDIVYVRTVSHILSIRNGLAINNIIPSLKNVVFNKGVASFLQATLAKYDTFHIDIVEGAAQSAQMTFQVEGLVVSRTIQRVVNPIDVSRYMTELPNTFEVNKVFLDDAIRRVTLGNTPALISFAVEDGNASITLSNKDSSANYSTTVPVVNYEGDSRSFAFQLSPKFLALMSTSYFTETKYEEMFPENIILQAGLIQHSEHAEPTISFGAKDANGLWQSMKINLKQAQ